MNKKTILGVLPIWAAAILFSVVGITPVAAEFFEGNTSNDWNVAANWDTVLVPTLLTDAAIASPFGPSTSVDIISANADALGLFVGLEAAGSVVDGTVNHSAFTGTYTNGMIIGRGGATGTYNQSGLTTDPNGASAVNTSLVAIGTEDVNAAVFAGTGIYNLSGDAQLDASSFVIMGETFGSTGTMTLNGNAVVNANLATTNANAFDAPSLIVGRLGSTGTLNVHDTSTVNVADRIHVGDFFGAKGTVNQDGGVVNSRAVWLGVFDDGSSSGTEGTYNISGTAQLNTLGMIVGRDGGKGTLDVSGSADVNVNGALVVGDFNGTVGAAANGTVTQSGGTVTADAWIGLGNAVGTTGTYNLSGGTLEVNAGDATPSGEDLNVGDAGTGTMNQTGGDVSARNWVVVGKNPGSTGTYNISGPSSTLTAGVDLRIGQDGTGTVNQDGGAVASNNWSVVGGAATGVGNYNLTGGSLDSVNLVVGELGNGTLTQDSTSSASSVSTVGDLFVGLRGGSTGTYNQNGGSVTVGVANDGNGSWLRIGDEVGAQGTYNMSGGTLTVNGRLELGVEGGNGDFVMSGGSVVVQDGGLDGGGAAQPGSLVIGRRGGGQFTQTAGTVNVEYVDIGGDPGFTAADFTQGGAYSLFGGSLTTTSTVGIRVGLSQEMPGGSGSTFDVENASITSGGGLEVGRNSDGKFRTFGSNVTATFAGDLSTSTGTATGVIGWGSDAAGVSALQIAGDVDVNGGVLQALFIAGFGTPVVPITTPHDLLLVDNQGNTWVDGLLSFDFDLDGIGDQLLEQGEQLDDTGSGVLGGVPYFISYYGLDGLSNDIYLTLVPVAVAANADFDADADVDGSDFLTWQQGFGGTGLSRPNGDADADALGAVDGVDFGIWGAQFGLPQTPPLSASVSAAVPEPTTLALLLGPMALMLMKRRRIA